MTETMKNRVMIFGPKVADGTYIVELRTAEGEALAISIPQQLCTLRVRRRRRLMQHSLPGRRYGFTGVCTGRSRPALPGAFPHSIPRRRRTSSVDARRGRALSPRQVDHQLQFRRKLKQHIAQLCALQYLVHI